jgi:hypothetical protein
MKMKRGKVRGSTTDTRQEKRGKSLTCPWGFMKEKGFYKPGKIFTAFMARL